MPLVATSPRTIAIRIKMSTWRCPHVCAVTTSFETRPAAWDASARNRRVIQHRAQQLRIAQMWMDPAGFPVSLGYRIRHAHAALCRVPNYTT